VATIMTMIQMFDGVSTRGLSVFIPYVVFPKLN